MKKNALARVFLLISIVCAPLSGNEQNLTTAQIRTLKNAVTVLQYQQHISLLVNRCDGEDNQDLLPSKEGIAAAKTSLQQLLQQKLQLNLQQLQTLFDNNIEFATLTRPTTVMIPSCDDHEAIADIAEHYSNNYTALELSEPMSSWQPLFTEGPAKPAIDPTELVNLIAASHSLVLVEVKPKSIITPLQQADYLHIDDKSSYLFEVQQGWKAIAPRYLGLHIHINTQNYPQQPKRWLLLLDANFHPKTAMSGEKMQQALQLLGSPGWSFNLHGDLLRTD